MKFVGLFENLNEGLNNLICDQMEMPRDGLKTALNEQLSTHFTPSHSLVVCDHRKNAKQIVPEDDNVTRPLYR